VWGSTRCTRPCSAPCRTKAGTAERPSPAQLRGISLSAHHRLCGPRRTGRLTANRGNLDFHQEPGIASAATCSAERTGRFADRRAEELRVACMNPSKSSLPPLAGSPTRKACILITSPSVRAGSRARLDGSERADGLRLRVAVAAIESFGAFGSLTVAPCRLKNTSVLPAALRRRLRWESAAIRQFVPDHVLRERKGRQRQQSERG